MSTDISLEFEPILGPEHYLTPPVIKVLVARMTGSRQDIPRAFKATKELCSAELRHLRRIRDLPDGSIDCVICPINSDTDADDKNTIDKIRRQLESEEIFDNFRVVKVPASAPRTEEQLDICNKLWPCKYAKSNYLIKCIEGNLLDEAEKIVIKIIAKNVINYIVNRDNEVNAGAVIFRCAKIYGVGLANNDLLAENPIKHPAMICIDSVATNSGSGHYKVTKHSELQNKIQTDLDAQDDLKGHQLEPNFLPYLCTNYDVFVTEQPCFMCTMGLVQSRIRRLFYLHPDSMQMVDGCCALCYPDNAIEESLVHRERNLNHRFEAWKVKMIDTS